MFKIYCISTQNPSKKFEEVKSRSQQLSFLYKIEQEVYRLKAITRRLLTLSQLDLHLDSTSFM